MSVNVLPAPFTKENLDDYLKDLAKEFRRLNGKAMPAEVILIGGASILINYGFREVTYDVDAIIMASSAMKDAIRNTADKRGLKGDWFNTDFMRTSSYSNKLVEVSVYYKTYANILKIRTIAAEYLIAMKLVSGRRYKHDLSDIIGILQEHHVLGKPITKELIDNAISLLYGDTVTLPESSHQILNALFNESKTGVDYESLYAQSIENEKEAKELLVEFNKNNPKILTDKNHEEILDNLRTQKGATKKTLLGRLEKIRGSKNPPPD